LIKLFQKFGPRQGRRRPGLTVDFGHTQGVDRKILKWYCSRRINTSFKEKKMSALVNVAEILDFAIYMEQKGYEFYTESAKKFADLKLVQLFHLLAQEELDHERIFKGIKEKTKTTASREIKNGDNQPGIKDYLKGFVFGINKSVKEKVGTIKTIEGALNTALGFERDSVVFYSTLKKYVDKKHAAVVENVVQEESRHVIMLTKFKSGQIPPPPDVNAL
jgi:rubrerythrin